MSHLSYVLFPEHARMDDVFWSSVVAALGPLSFREADEHWSKPKPTEGYFYLMPGPRPLTGAPQLLISQGSSWYEDRWVLPWNQDVEHRLARHTQYLSVQAWGDDGIGLDFSDAFIEAAASALGGILYLEGSDALFPVSRSRVLDLDEACVELARINGQTSEPPPRDSVIWSTVPPPSLGAFSVVVRAPSPVAPDRVASEARSSWWPHMALHGSEVESERWRTFELRELSEEHAIASFVRIGAVTEVSAEVRITFDVAAGAQRDADAMHRVAVFAEQLVETFTAKLGWEPVALEAE